MISKYCDMCIVATAAVSVEPSSGNIGIQLEFGSMWQEKCEHFLKNTHFYGRCFFFNSNSLNILCCEFFCSELQKKTPPNIQTQIICLQWEKILMNHINVLLISILRRTQRQYWKAKKIDGNFTIFFHTMVEFPVKYWNYYFFKICPLIVKSVFILSFFPL